MRSSDSLSDFARGSWYQSGYFKGMHRRVPHLIRIERERVYFKTRPYALRNEKGAGSNVARDRLRDDASIYRLLADLIEIIRRSGYLTIDRTLPWYFPNDATDFDASCSVPLILQTCSFCDCCFGGAGSSACAPAVAPRHSASSSALANTFYTAC